MKEVYLAYFDFLGFKEFIHNNEDDEIVRRMVHIFRDIELALSRGKTKPSEKHRSVVIPDLSESSINSLNISDTVIFWTNECNLDLLKELIEVTNEFNWRENKFNFPIRGCLTKGKIKFLPFQLNKSNSTIHSIQSMYGKGLVYAHEKAESQSWAGTVVDKSIIDDLGEDMELINKSCVKYKVPYKNGEATEEYVFKLCIGGKIREQVEQVFRQDNKSIENDSVKAKIDNTVAFAEDLSSIENQE